MTGVVTAYDDVADLLYQVWGDQWEVSADHVTAEVILPDGAGEGAGPGVGLIGLAQREAIGIEQELPFGVHRRERR